MESRFIEATMKSSALVSALARRGISQWIRPSSSLSGTRDPATNLDDTEGLDPEEVGKRIASETRDPTSDTEGLDAEEVRKRIESDEKEKERQMEEKSRKGKEENAPFSYGKLPYVPKTTLESEPVSSPAEPSFQQKRRNHSAAQDVSCVGVDGSPLPKGVNGDEEEEMIDYYKHHKASPLSEIEFADTRKPITRATDGTADYGGDPDVIGWKEEQLESAEETMERATRIWKQNAMRDDPDSPQSRALRAMLGQLSFEKSDTI